LKKLVLLLLLVFTIACQAQKVWFGDDFNDYSKGWLWSNYNSPEIDRRIADGKFYIDQKQDGRPYWTFVPTWLDRAKDFILETSILQTEGNPNNGFGHIISGADGRYFYFLINPSKQLFWVGNNKQGIEQAMTPSRNWESSPAIKGLSAPNKLTVQRKGPKLLFFINDSEVYQGVVDVDFRELVYAEYFGIVTNGAMKIEADYFTLRQDNVLNIVPDLPKKPLEKVNLGPNVKSRYTEITPVISPDGKTLYMTVAGDPANVNKSYDIYYATAINDSSWLPRVPAGAPLNNASPNTVISVSPDNNSLVLMHTYNPDGSAKGTGLSISTKTETGWSVPTDLIIANHYNKAIYNEFCMSADRQVLLMAVERNDTFGQKDIYVSFRDSNGNYSEPKNLGNVVNTPSTEASPFLATDEESLYYSSTGHPGLGSADIFVTKRLDSTWTKWSPPQNMGQGINSPAWEAYYSVPASGSYAYVVSQEKSLGETDIFRIKLPEVLKPRPVVLIYGKVLNSKTKSPLESNIAYNILASNKLSGIAISNVKDGSYKIVLPAGEAYSFLAKKDGFYSVSENIDLKELKAYKEIERNLFLAPIEVGGTILLNNLFFDLNKTELRKESAAELERMVSLMSNHQAMIVEIAGHTDNTGTDEHNNKLSIDRANAVRNYLLKKGIRPERIRARGFGRTKPSASNQTEVGRQRNRRVEFTILKD
jgi:outer membrane protein OmpA-like peptidoglycan-associated protein